MLCIDGMIMQQYRLRRWGVVISCLYLIGCTAVKQTTPTDIPLAAQFYVIDIDRGIREHTPPSAPVLYIPQVATIAQFRSKNLVFRVAENQYERQPHLFFDTPQVMLRDQINRWFVKSGLFSAITLNSDTPHDYVLEVALTGLYADNSIATAKAVSELQFFLIDAAAKQGNVVFQTGLHIDIPLTELTPTTAVAGWKRGLEKIMQTVENDLADHFSVMSSTQSEE